MKIKSVLIQAAFLILCFYPYSVNAQQQTYVPELFNLNPAGVSSSQICRQCHEDIYDTWSESMHFKSYTDPVFQSAVLEAQLKRGESIRLYCLRCHTPLIQINNDTELTRSVTMEGVTCDFCHSITKVNVNNMETPYEFDPGVHKYGPIKDASSPAHQAVYSELHTKSEFCAGCHQLINENGVLIMGTYTEWLEGPYPESDIQCQNCHMPIEFDLKVVKPEVKKVDHFVTAHRFQGGHSQINLENAANLSVSLSRRNTEANVTVYITNEESGHKIPTGTPARKLNLVVSLFDEKGNQFATTTKVYEKVLVDKDGNILKDNASQILDAYKILSDNRIAPKETRREEFSFTIPDSINSIKANAKLIYIFETPVLQKELMMVEMANATDTYIINYTAPDSSENPLMFFAALLAAVVIGGTVLYYFKNVRTPLSSGKKMLAVLRFENLGNEEDNYFADGLADAITARLSNIQALGIISRQSAMQYAKTDKSAQQIGKELNIGYILEGTVQREKPGGADSKIRIIPRLIRTSDNTQVWSSTFDEEMSDVFRIQTELAEHVAEALDISLLKPERRALESKPTENIEAYEFYLQGNVYRAKSLLEEDVRIAIQMYEKALNLDPNFAAAYAVLSYARIWLHWQFGRYEELAKAKVALDKAVALDPELPKTRMALGYYYYWGSRDYNNALKQFSFVQKQQPSNAEAHAAIGYIQRRQGLWKKALSSIKKALELDPRNHFIAVNLGRTYLRLRKYEDAEHYLDRAISLAPDIPVYYLRKVTLYISWDGATKRARQALDEASGKVDPKSLAITRGRLEAFDGNYEKAIEMLGEKSDSTRYKLYRAFFHHLMAQEDSAKEYYKSAHADLAQIVKKQPENPFGLRELGIAYAGTGHIEEAIMTGNKAEELLPVSKDAFYGPDILENLAWIYMMSSDFDTAIDKLEYLLSIPSRISLPRLRIDPRWIMLRDNERFKKLIEIDQ